MKDILDSTSTMILLIAASLIAGVFFGFYLGHSSVVNDCNNFSAFSVNHEIYSCARQPTPQPQRGAK